MSRSRLQVVTRILLVSGLLTLLLGLAVVCGLAWGATGGGIRAMLDTMLGGGMSDNTAAMINEALAASVESAIRYFEEL